MPDRLKTLEMCWTAVDGFDDALDFVPDGLKMLEMCACAYGRRQVWEDCWRGIPERFKAEVARRFKPFEEE